MQFANWVGQCNLGPTSYVSIYTVTVKKNLLYWSLVVSAADDSRQSS